jgi:hypothetical protein
MVGWQIHQQVNIHLYEYWIRFMSIMRKQKLTGIYGIDFAIENNTSIARGVTNDHQQDIHTAFFNIVMINNVLNDDVKTKIVIIMKG